MSGWIKIDRKIQEHWIFNDSWKFRNWIDLILMVNHRDNKVELNGTLFNCKRGETLRSLQTLATRWRCSKSKVRRFLELLQKEDMIRLKNETKTTRITICKYDTYQIPDTAVKRKRNKDETQTNPNKNEKSEKKKKTFKKNLDMFVDKYGSEMIEDFYLYWTEETPKGLLRFETMKAFSLGRRLGTWNKNRIQRENQSGGDDYQTHVLNQIRKGGHNG